LFLNFEQKGASCSYKIVHIKKVYAHVAANKRALEAQFCLGQWEAIDPLSTLLNKSTIFLHIKT